MTVTGIIAEFNPFHNGHKYLLEQAEGVKIVVMSGNFVQRGGPAIVDKWTRAQMALENGADLVVELPFLVAVQSADHFAKGAVEILSRLGIDQLTFGTEEVLDYQAIATVYSENEAEMEAFLRSLPDDLSYPQKTQKMWETFAGVEFTGDTPNHILGLAYAKACAGKGIALKSVQRQGAGYHSEEKEVANRIKDAVRGASSVEELVEKVATKRYTKARVRRILTYILVGAMDQALPDAIHVLGFSAKGQAHLKGLKKSVGIVTRIGKEPWDSLTQQADQVYQLGHPQLRDQIWGRVPVRVEE